MSQYENLLLTALDEIQRLKAQVEDLSNRVQVLEDSNSSSISVSSVSVPINNVSSVSEPRKFLNRETELVFKPSDLKAFKDRLINNKVAYRTFYYEDGSTKNDMWQARNFDESSGLLGNIKSTAWWRQRREKGIVKVVFEVD